MKKLLIVGAGGFGREILTWAQDVQPCKDWTIDGFLDRDSRALDGYDIELQIIGDPATWQPTDDTVLVCAIGEPKIKLDVCRALELRGAAFETLIHPTAKVGPRCTLGKGVVLCPQSVLTCDVTLGDFVTFNVAATAGHDAKIGHGCTLCGHTDVTGFASLGEAVFLGSHAAVLPRVHVGDAATIGAGSIAMRHVKAGTTVVGIPAKRVF